MCWVWGPNTLSHTSLSYLFPHPNTFSYYPHISPHLLKVWQSYHVTKLQHTSPPSPYHSLHLRLPPSHPNTLSHTSLSYLFPHLPFLAPHPNTFSYYPHISPHLLRVWRSYHVTKFLWRSCWQLEILAVIIYHKIIKPKFSWNWQLQSSETANLAVWA